MIGVVVVADCVDVDVDVDVDVCVSEQGVVECVCVAACLYVWLHV